MNHFCDAGERVLVAEIKLHNHEEPTCQNAKSAASHFQSQRRPGLTAKAQRARKGERDKVRQNKLVTGCERKREEMREGEIKEEERRKEGEKERKGEIH